MPTIVTPPEGSTCCGEQNVGTAERVISIIGGASLLLGGVVRRGGSGVGLAVLGGALLYRGLAGHCYLYDALGIDTTKMDEGEGEEEPKELPAAHA